MSNKVTEMPRVQPPRPVASPQVRGKDMNQLRNAPKDGTRWQVGHVHCAVLQGQGNIVGEIVCERFDESPLD